MYMSIDKERGGGGGKHSSLVNSIRQDILLKLAKNCPERNIHNSQGGSITPTTPTGLRL